MAAQKDQINLLPQKGFEASTAGRVLAWILSTFRVIVIVTEIIVVVAFLSRFWLDAQNTDLSESIEERQAVLAASIGFEKNFKNTQQRLAILSSAEANKTDISSALTTITSFLPEDLYLSALYFDKKTVSIEGYSSNENSIQRLIVNLQSSENFTDVSLSELESDTVDPSILKFALLVSQEKETSE